jgi:hypothetical protein
MRLITCLRMELYDINYGLLVEMYEIKYLIAYGAV